MPELHARAKTDGEAVRDRLTRLEGHVEGLVEELSAIRREMHELRLGLQESKQIRWGSIWPAVGLAAGLMAAAGTAFITPLSRDVAALNRETELRDQETTRDVRDIVDRVTKHEDEFRSLLTTTAHDLEDRRDRQLAQKLEVVNVRLDLEATRRDWLNDIVNIENRVATRWTAALWQSVFKEPLPMVEMPSVGPDAHGP